MAHQLPLRADGTFRILQITDFHNDQGSPDAAERSWLDVDVLVRRLQPDFLAVTGDVWCSDEAPEHGPARMQRDLERIVGFGVPWAFTWGNHDWVDDAARRYREMAGMTGASMEVNDGRGCCRIEVCRGGAPVWDVFFIDSGLEWDPSTDLAWFESESARLAAERGGELPAVAYFHIPLQQYEAARLAGTYTGFAGEEVLCWGDDGSILPRLGERGVRVCFCGHSHANDFYVEQDGVVLAYGRATGYGGYGGDLLKKGAKLLTLNADQAFAFETVFADGGREWPYSSSSDS